MNKSVDLTSSQASPVQFCASYSRTREVLSLPFSAAGTRSGEAALGNLFAPVLACPIS